MEVSFFERRKILKSASLLDLTPMAKVSHEVDDAGMVTLLYPKFKNKKVSKYMLGNRSPFIHMKLDEIGTASWLLIDGKKKVSEIADLLTEQFGDKIHPVNERLGKFLSQLYDNKYITFIELLKKEK
ncbi:MAG TPA: PqqD family protein [Bacteroidales bacterium]|nr:PqqD family protein [Bacteroidales bacterium]HPS18163.1 PqqD family protein [Bacteroidales bacterium]